MFDDIRIYSKQKLFVFVLSIYSIFFKQVHTKFLAYWSLTSPMVGKEVSSHCLLVLIEGGGGILSAKIWRRLCCFHQFLWGQLSRLYFCSLTYLASDLILKHVTTNFFNNVKVTISDSVIHYHLQDFSSNNLLTYNGSNRPRIALYETSLDTSVKSIYSGDKNILKFRNIMSLSSYSLLSSTHDKRLSYSHKLKPHVQFLIFKNII